MADFVSFLIWMGFLLSVLFLSFAIMPIKFPLVVKPWWVEHTTQEMREKALEIDPSASHATEYYKDKRGLAEYYVENDIIEDESEILDMD